MSLAFHPDGERLAAADYGGPIVVLWDLASGAVVRQPAPEAISCVAFAPDGRRLASMGYDGHVHLADARTAEELLVLRNPGPSTGTLGLLAPAGVQPHGTRIVAHSFFHLNVWEAGLPPAGGPIDVRGPRGMAPARSRPGGAATRRGPRRRSRRPERCRPMTQSLGWSTPRSWPRSRPGRRQGCLRSGPRLPVRRSHDLAGLRDASPASGLDPEADAVRDRARPWPNEGWRARSVTKRRSIP